MTSIVGYFGSSILDVNTSKKNSFKFVRPRNEQGAGHMAEGYARASGKPGVLVVKAGYNATNLVTPMMDALSDGTPLVVFCFQRSTPSELMKHGEIQEGDILSISQPCTKWNVAVNHASELSDRVHEAFEIAQSGRPGPVLVRILDSVMTDMAMESYNPPGPAASRRSLVDIELYKVRQRELDEGLQRTARLINQSKRPVLYVGQGILATPDGPKLLRKLADQACIPVTTTLQGLGAFDETDDKALHMLGLHGSGYANTAMQEADLIIALGARFDDRVTGSVAKFAPKAKAAADQGRGGIVHFDISPKNINKVVEATESIVGDCAENLRLLLPMVTKVDRPGWMADIASWKHKYPMSGFWAKRKSPDDLVQPQGFLERLDSRIKTTEQPTVITAGVGQHQMWAAQHIQWKYPRSFISSGGLGTMGFGLPAAIGAKIARPEALVINIDGDASLSMTINELLTASQYDLDVKTIVLNNQEQGMVTHLQTMYFGNRYAHSHGQNADFVHTARSMGVQAERCVSHDQVDEKLEWLLETRGPALLEVMITQKALSLPVVPAGRALHEFITYSAEDIQLSAPSGE